MLVAVYSGPERDASKKRGNLYFDVAPQVGDHVDLDGADQIVRKVWHMPDAYFAGPKMAVLVFHKAGIERPSGGSIAPSVALV